jgi:hypothetical protein
MRPNQSLHIVHWISGHLLAFAIIYVVQLAGITGCSTTPTQTVAGACLETKPGTRATMLPKHVFLIVLENEGYDQTFGSEGALRWLVNAHLHKDGRLLTNYYAIGHNSLVNYIGMISGQTPNRDSKQDCLWFLKLRDFEPMSKDDFLVGPQAHGCVYPNTVATIASQLDEHHFSWEAYMEDMDRAASFARHRRDESPTCRHPDELDHADCTNQARMYVDERGKPIFDQYTTRHNPFVYFQSITDDPNYCDAHDLPLKDSAGLGDLLKPEVEASKTPNLVFISPNLCDDGHDPQGAMEEQQWLPGLAKKGGIGAIRGYLKLQCGHRGYKFPELQPGRCASGDEGNEAGITRFLNIWIPKIMGSRAYQQDGMIIITFDEAKDTNDTHGVSYDSNGKGSEVDRVGGGKVGALVISNLVNPVEDSKPYNHYALLRSIEDLFGHPPPLGMACYSTSFSLESNDFYKIEASPVPPNK